MSYKIKIDPAARIDLLESIQWYNRQQSGLGHRYYNHIQQSVKLIGKNPYFFQVRYKDLRMAPVKKFPFMILYIIDEDKKQIAITAFLHTSRNPKIWEERSE